MSGALQLPNPQPQGALTQSAAYDLSKPADVVAPGNLDPFHRKVLQNPDGGYSTARTFSVGTDKGEVLIPQVVNGTLLTKRQAIAHYMRTGQHFGIFKTPEAADQYATALHNAQQRVIEQKTAPPQVQGAFQPEQQFTPPVALPAGTLSKDQINAVNKKYP
jgi:hypothetical protein